MFVQDNSGELRLINAVAEQLKTPLQIIALESQLEQVSLADIQQTARQAIQFIDSYLLSIKGSLQASLALEPVSLTAVAQDVAYALEPIAKDYNCQIELNLSKTGPVMAEPRQLNAALELLGQMMIEANVDHQKPRIVRLIVRKTKQGIATGVFGSQTQINADSFRRARALFGNARQPIPISHPSSAAGIFIADSLFQNMSYRLRPSRIGGFNGLSATLLPSQQLQLI